jgi:hypothetical protein
MKSQAFGAIALAIFTAYANAAAPSRDLAVEVDCTKGESIGVALERPVVFERRIIVTVSGTCAENLVIERDDVTLRGAVPGAGIDAPDATQPAIRVDGARRTSIEALSIRGGQHGVRLTGGAAARLRDSRVFEAAEDGLRVDGGSSAEVDDCVMEGNGQEGVTARGTVTVRGSTIRGNRFSGVVAHRGGQLFLGANRGNLICCGNVIENNLLDGVTVADNGGAVLFGNTIRGNGLGGGGRFGVFVINGSSARLMGGNVVQQNGAQVGPNQFGGGGIFVRGAMVRTGFGDVPLTPATNEVSGNVVGIQTAENGTLDLRSGLSVVNNQFNGIHLSHGTRMRLEAATVSGNGGHGVFVQRASSVDLSGATPNIISGNGGFGLLCADAESSFSGNASGITGNGAPPQVSCTGF